MRARAAALAAALVTAALLAGGCGSDSLSLNDLRTQATTACQTARQRADRIAPPATPAQAERFLTAGIAAMQPEIDALRRLTPPAGDQQTYNDAVGSLSATVGALRATAAAIRSGGDPVIAVRALEARIAPLAQRGSQDWRSLGVPACATS